MSDENSMHRSIMIRIPMIPSRRKSPIHLTPLPPTRNSPSFIRNDVNWGNSIGIDEVEVGGHAGRGVDVETGVGLSGRGEEAGEHVGE